MKRLIATIVILAFACTLMAAESDPSETVGFVKYDTDVGYNLFSLPVAYDDYEVTYVLGTQPGLTSGDKVTDMNLGTVMTYYGAVNGWWPLDNILPGNGYLLEVSADSAIYLAGEVNPSIIVKLINPGFTIFALDESRNVLIADSTLGIPNLLSGDKITDINNGTITTYYGAVNGWWPDNNYIDPIHVYLLETAYPDTFTWTYIPNPPAGPLGKNLTVVKKPVPTKIKSVGITPSVKNPAVKKQDVKIIRSKKVKSNNY